MRNAATAYLITLVLCIVGMWVILAQGARLQAPPHVAGTWLLTRQSEETTARLSAVIEQSGGFVRVSVNGGAFIDYRLEAAREEDHDEADEIDEIGEIGEKDEIGEIIATLSSPEDTIALISTDGTAAGISRFVRTFTGAPGDGATSVTVYDAERVDAAAGAIAATAATPPNRAGDTARPASAARPSHPILLLIAQLTVIVVTARVLGTLASYFRQPRVMGEMIAGLLLGPSLLGWVFPGASALLFPAESIPFLGMLAQLGVVFFLFTIGLELNPQLIRSRGHVAVVISHVSIVAPFLLGSALALFLYGRVFNDTPMMHFSSVALFLGAAMSITAFPVLARILTERNLHKTQVGAISITCAAIGDASAWCVLAFIVGVARAEGLTQAVITSGLAVVYVVVMVFAVRPFLRRIEAYHDREGRLTTGVLALLVVVVLLSSLATEAIGIHALFGAFMAGVIMPKGGRFVRDVTARLEPFTLVVLLPIFFAFTGLMTRVELLNSPELLVMTFVIILVACAGKFGGSTLAAVACGMTWREASAVGILMNTRGLMELVILNIGRELGVITDAVFAMLVLMALVTTLLTTPILDRVYPDRFIRVRPAPGPGGRRHDVVLIPISLPRSGRALVRIADLVTGPHTPGRRIIGLHLRRAEEHEAYGGAETPAEPLVALKADAEEMGIVVEPVSFVSVDAATDIARTAADCGAGLILMGFHKPVIGTTILGGTVHRVLVEAPADVAILLDRGLPERPRSILVTYMNNEHDRLALELASSIARHARAAVTLLHIVPPDDAPDADGRQRGRARAVAEHVLADPTQPVPITFKVLASREPIDTVLEHCPRFDLVVVGVAEELGLKSQLFGWNAERLARDCPTSILIVRRAPGAAGHAP